MINTAYSVIRLLSQGLRYFLHTFAKAEQDSVYQCCKISCLDFKEIALLVQKRCESSMWISLLQLRVLKKEMKA